MQYFEESFIEEDDSFIAESVDQIEGHDDNGGFYCSLDSLDADKVNNYNQK